MVNTTLHIEVVSDIVCPWCYIGKRRLETALQLLAKAHAQLPAPKVSWLPFQLNPDLPASGVSRADYLQRKFGDPKGGGMYERVSAEGRKEGIEFDFNAIQRQPNTLRAHALLAAALQSDDSGRLQNQLKEALLQAYFCQGADLTKDATLEAIAAKAGMPLSTAQATLQDTTAHQKAAAEDAELRRIGISGVPFFIMNRTTGVSGAQPPQALLEAMESALSQAR